jgi:signal transduction histidine kinase
LSNEHVTRPHADDAPASFAEVDIRALLESRPSRVPDYESEDRALAALAAELAENPRDMLQKLVEMALTLCQADTAGISLLENHTGVELFRWEALAGVFALARNNTMPREASPCGVCINENATQLMYLADRCFPALRNDPRFVEALLVPFRYRGLPVGTVWVVTHRFDRKFDREDERLIRTLAAFASAGWQSWRAQVELERRVAERTAELSEMNLVLQSEIDRRKRTEEERVRLLRRIALAEEDERRRMAREMHDQLGQQLSALTLKLAALKADCGEQAELRIQIESLQTIAKQLDEDVDFLVWELRPAALDDLGLVAALSQYVRNWSKHFGVSAELHASGIEKDRLTIEMETALYRIAQEALNNVAKHARAQKVDILLECHSGQISLIVEDNGVGFEGERMLGAGDRGMGLIGMRERAALAGGTLVVESNPGSGSTIAVRIPAHNLGSGKTHNA